MDIQNITLTATENDINRTIVEKKKKKEKVFKSKKPWTVCPRIFFDLRGGHAQRSLFFMIF